MPSRDEQIEDQIKLEVEIQHDETIPTEKLAQLTNQLQENLQGLPLSDVSRRESMKSGDMPKGAMSGSPIDLNILFITLAPTVVPVLLHFLLDHFKNPKISMIIRHTVDETTYEYSVTGGTHNKDKIDEALREMHEKLNLKTHDE